MKLNFNWRKKTSQYSNGEALFLNRICIANYDWNVVRSKDDKDQSTTWIGTIILPSLKNDRVYGTDEQEIRQKIEATVISWFTEALKEAQNG